MIKIIKNRIGSINIGNKNNKEIVKIYDMNNKMSNIMLELKLKKLPLIKTSRHSHKSLRAPYWGIR